MSLTSYQTAPPCNTGEKYTLFALVDRRVAKKRESNWIVNAFWGDFRKLWQITACQEEGGAYVCRFFKN